MTRKIEIFNKNNTLKKHFFHLEEHIYLSIFQNEAILLNIKKNTYQILQKEISETLCCLIENAFYRKGASYEIATPLKLPFQKKEFNQFISQLIKENIIKDEAYNFPYPFKIEKRIHSSGIYCPTWRLSIGKTFGASCVKMILESLIILSKVHFYSKIRKFYGLVMSLKIHKQKYERVFLYPSVYPSSDNIKILINSLNKACLIYPKETKCLEWSTALVLMALKRGWKFNLCVGVQNYPFIAHAWVEHCGKILSDTSDFPEDFSPILKEPFRDKKETLI
ncbi:MAG: lasso peptide biosynthesis B2 protein [Proteobacteria bacterium]|nr:lasso peptide biosynthesis B2 protein [Pseudomonadota bacterium]